MKRKLAIILIAAIFSSYIPTPVYADATDDQIAKIEKQIEILQAQLEKLKRKKGEQTETSRPKMLLSAWLNRQSEKNIKLRQYRHITKTAVRDILMKLKQNPETRLLL